MKTAYDWGWEFASVNKADEKNEDWEGKTQDLPEEDYLDMKRAGVNPDARLYWAGYNEYVARRGEGETSDTERREVHPDEEGAYNTDTSVPWCRELRYKHEEVQT